MQTENKHAFLSELYTKYTRDLFTFSLSLLRSLPDAFSLAEECVQETFEKATWKVGTLKRLDSPKAWLINTCRKITISKRRKLLNRKSITGKQVSLDEACIVIDDHDRIEEWILRNDLLNGKQQLIDALTEQERAVFDLYYEKNHTLKDTASLLNLSENAVHGAIHRIKAKAVKFF